MDFLRRLLGLPAEPVAKADSTLPSRPAPGSTSLSGAPAAVVTPPSANNNSTPSSNNNNIPTPTISQGRPDGMSNAAPEDLVIEAPPGARKPVTSPLGDIVVEVDQSPTPMPFGNTRPLPPLETYISKPGKHLTYGMNSDIGLQRNNNQDSMLTFFTSNVSVEERPDFGLFAVADGMGGHHDGEKASAITIRILTQYIIDKLYLNMLAAPVDSDDRPIISETLADAVLRANSAVSEQIPEGGTTVTAVLIMGDLAYVAHVGDSRAYLITGDAMEQITRDHSLVQRLIELDQLTPEEASTHPQRNVLYRAIGQSENLEVDAVTRRLPPNSRLLICSDGLWGQVPEEVLLDVVRSAKSPQEACDRLVAAANERGGPDNITAVIVQIPG